MKNFNFLIVALVIGIGFSACSKKNTEYYDPQKYLTLEAPVIEKYVKGIENAVWDSTGIWYAIEEVGLTDSADANYYEYNINNADRIEVPFVSIKYQLRLVADSSLVQDGTITINKATGDGYLGNLVYGMQLAFLPRYIEDKSGELQKTVGLGILEHGLQKGSKIRLILPSPYAYGNEIRTGIPANSPLDFTIEVLEVKPPN